MPSASLSCQKEKYAPPTLDYHRPSKRKWSDEVILVALEAELLSKGQLLNRRQTLG